MFWLAARQDEEGNKQQTLGDSMVWDPRREISCAHDPALNHWATASFAAFAGRESSQISISMAVGPTMKSA